MYTRCVQTFPQSLEGLCASTGSIAVAKEEDDRNTIPFKRLLLGCAWFQIYDLIEDTFSQLVFHEQELAGPDEEARAFPMQQVINDYFLRAGIGWRMVDGKIIVRSSEAFEAVVTTAAAVLKEFERPTAAKHLHEALQDLSRRPEADLAGAIYHAMGSMEYVARDLSGAPKATLGEILKRYPELLPKPLDLALSQVWGYASNEARQVLEGRDPIREEAQLIVGLAVTVTTYLIRKTAASGK